MQTLRSQTNGTFCHSYDVTTHPNPAVDFAGGAIFCSERKLTCGSREASLWLCFRRVAEGFSVYTGTVLSHK